MIGRQPYLLGDTISAADVLWGIALHWGMLFKRVPKREPITGYVKRVKLRPAALKVAEMDATLAAKQKAERVPEPRQVNVLESRMAASRDFQREQRGVAIRMAAGLGVTILVSAACLHWAHGTTPPLVERLTDTATADVFVVCWLAAAIGNVARLRFFSADDIAGSGSGKATAEVGKASAVLQNTLEQVALAIPVHAALAVLVASSLPLIEAFAALFAIGRLLFWIGYERGAQARALGFALTFYPSLAGLIIAVVAALRLAL